MITDLLEKKLDDWREQWGRFYYSDLVGMDWEKPEKPNFAPNKETKARGSDGKCLASDTMEAFLTSSLKEAYLAGLTAAEGCVPDNRDTTSVIHTRDIIQMSTTDIEMAQNQGWNRAVHQTLSSIQKLKEEVSDMNV